MRDNHSGLPEILHCYQVGNDCFAAVRVTVNDTTKTFEIGLGIESYNCLSKALSLRPFDKMAGVTYRYFHVPSARLDEESGKLYTQLRIEQNSNAKQFEVETTRELTSNLIWFFELKDFASTQHLKELI